MVSGTRSVGVALQILVGFPGSSLMRSGVVEGFVVFALVFCHWMSLWVLTLLFWGLVDIVCG